MLFSFRRRRVKRESMDDEVVISEARRVKQETMDDEVVFISRYVVSNEEMW